MSFDEGSGKLAALDPETGSVWYVAYTRPRMESTALLNLERQGFNVYLPLYKSVRQLSAGWQPAFEPLFPRYIFLSPADAATSLSVVGSTRGVQSLVRFGPQLAQVSPQMLETIRDFERVRNQQGLETLSPIKPGARVRMRKGALNSIEGLVVSVARHRVTFLLQMLGRQKEVTVDHGELALA